MLVLCVSYSVGSYRMLLCDGTQPPERLIVTARITETKYCISFGGEKSFNKCVCERENEFSSISVHSLNSHCSGDLG